MRTRPFTPTPQQARNADEDGRSPAGGAWALLVLAVQACAVVAVGAVVCYRRTPRRIAHLVTTAPLLVVTVMLAVAVSRMLPAWT